MLFSDFNSSKNMRLLAKGTARTQTAENNPAAASRNQSIPVAPNTKKKTKTKKKMKKNTRTKTKTTSLRRHGGNRFLRRLNPVFAAEMYSKRHFRRGNAYFRSGNYYFRFGNPRISPKTISGKCHQTRQMPLLPK